MFRRRAISSHPALGDPLKDYVFYEKLQGDGLAYIVTDYYPNSLDNFRVIYDKVTTSATRHIFGAREDTTTKLVYLAQSNSVNYICRFINESPTFFPTNYDKWDVLMGIGETRTTDYVIINEGYKELQVHEATSDFDIAFPIVLFAMNAAGTSNISTPYVYNGAIYSFQVISSVTGKIKRDFYPCTYKGEPGMYEAVKGKFYPNSAGKGTFTPINKL